MPPMEDGSKLNVEGVKGNEDEYDFMTDARDIMNKFTRPDAAASTKIRAFHETFGTSLPIVSMVWSMLWEEDVVPEGGRPKHLLWALHFLKVIPYRPRSVQPSAGLPAPLTRRPTKSGSGRLSTPLRNLLMKW